MVKRGGDCGLSPIVESIGSIEAVVVVFLALWGRVAAFLCWRRWDDCVCVVGLVSPFVELAGSDLVWARVTGGMVALPCTVEISC
jgi:hypothetical protein